MTVKRSFAPVVNKSVKILILGSLPGEVSLAQNQYYANPQNRFWMLISEVINTDLASLPYQTRLKSLLKNGIGLWDVVAEAKRTGSLDSNIREHVHNDLHSLLHGLPQLHTIAFNGGTAERLGLKALQKKADDYRLIRLPSSSPAYTIPYAEKLAAWRNLQLK